MRRRMTLFFTLHLTALLIIIGIKIQKLCRGAELCKRKVIESIVAYISQVVLFKSGFAFVLEFLETIKIGRAHV